MHVEMEQTNNHNLEAKIIDPSMNTIQQTDNQFPIPKQFIWPKDHVSRAPVEVLNEHVIDLQGFFKHDEKAKLHEASLVNESCLKHGFFQVINHGIDPKLLTLAYEHGWAFFQLPITEKSKCKKKEGSMNDFSNGHAHRFAEKLPWKECLTFEYHENDSDEVAAEFFNSTYGSQYKETGLVYQKFCHEMRKVALDILELLEISLGVTSRKYYRQLFEDCVSIVRNNYYPKCDTPELTYGVGPHRDPTTLTVLYQDQIGGLEVFVDNKWKAVQPRPNALVINIGDTFKALSNGKYMSCLHRVTVNPATPRLSLAFFLCPKSDKKMKPHQELIDKDGKQEYPDFTWEEFLRFTQKHHRADENTLDLFNEWLKSSKSSNA